MTFGRVTPARTRKAPMLTVGLYRQREQLPVHLPVPGRILGATAAIWMSLVTRASALSRLQPRVPEWRALLGPVALLLSMQTTVPFSGAH